MLNRKLILDVGEQKIDQRFEAPLPRQPERGKEGEAKQTTNHKLKTTN